MKSLKKLALVTVGMLLSLQVPASAQSATQNILLNATVADYCTIAGGATGASVTRNITVNTGTVSTAALQVVTVGSVACSKVSNVVLSTTNTGLTGPTAASGFQNVIHYTATASYSGATPSLTTPAASATAATSGAANGTLTVNITPIANDSPMVAGFYADTLVVTLTPQP